MAASTAQSSSKKKASKPVERTESPAPSTASADKTGDDGFESPYIKELHKNIRNINKKIANASKTDSILAQHKGKSLEDLVSAKILNTDQRAQILKKPALQAQLAQSEEQLAQYQKIHEQYRTKADAEKANLDKTIEKARADAMSEAKAEFEQATRDNLLVLSQFLRLAAYRREEAADPEADESQAIEGVLLAIYAGDENAVTSMYNLVKGTEERIVSIPGQELATSYSNIKTLAQGYKVPQYAEGTQAEAAVETTAEEQTPSVAATEEATNGNDLSISQEWVDVKTPKEPVEAPAAVPDPAPAATQSWADDQPEPVAVKTPAAPAAPAAPTDANDGFSQVQRNRGRHEREGSNARGGRGGRGGRGNHRGDGRGGRGRGNRNSGVPSRPRRNEE